MNTGKLQRFGYKDSPYLRPNQDWVCGYADSGQDCPRGPDARGRCAGSDHCDPIREGGRWVCTRSDLLGGICEAGPAPRRCGSALPPCQPRRSLRARRRLLTRWVATLTVGMLLLIVGGTQGMALLEPGPRVHAHAQLSNCAACHASAEHRPSAWIGMIFRDEEVDDSQRCVHCHRVGEQPLLAHGLSAEKRETLRAVNGAAGSGSLPVALAADWLVDPGAPLDCGQCHREHRGADADISAISDGRCQSCHAQRFASFEDGHPAFSAAYPSTRRTRIQFDHVTHIGRHFADADDSQAVPTACADCHLAADHGGMMTIRSFEATCSGCHAGDIAGAGRADSPGLAVLQVPGFDVESLHAAGLVTGHWPEFAEGRGGVFLPVLLRTDEAAGQALAAIEELDWFDLTAADDTQLRAVQTLIWAYKRLLLDLRAGGAPALLDRLDGAGGALDDDLRRRLASGLSVHAIEAAVDAWFPGLSDEWAAYQAGELTPPAVTRTPVVATRDEPEVDEDEFADLFGSGDLLGDDAAAEPAADAGGGEVDDEEFDALFGGDDLFSGDADLFAEDEEVTEPEPEAPAIASLDARMRLGGWFLDDLALRYRPAGHADALIQAWLDQPHQPSVVEELTNPDVPGRCTKCHSVDATDQGLSVNWHAAQPDPQMHAFTEFSHRSHFTVMGEDGCSGCHSLNAESAYAEAFAGTDPSAFASNFQAIDKQRCASCHMGEQAGDSCTTCHSYHVGKFAATEPFTRLSEALAEP